MIVKGPKIPTALNKQQYEEMTKRVQKKITTRVCKKIKRSQKVTCEICLEKMVYGSLKRHMMNQHGIDESKEPNQEVEMTTGRRTYVIDMEPKGRKTDCPVEGCPGGSKDKSGMYRHFCLKHASATIVIVEDGPLPRCPECHMFVKDVAKHKDSFTCKKGQQRRTNENLERKQKSAEDMDITVYGKKLERVTEFKYLGRILSQNDDDSKCIEQQLKRARARWNNVAQILKREGANAPTMARFYKAIIQAVLLYGSESWTITKLNWDRLRSFHKRAIRYMTTTHIRKISEDRWEYPDSEALREKCKLETIETYIKRRRWTLRKYLLKNRKELLEKAEKMYVPARNVHKILLWKQECETGEDLA